MRIAVDAMGGDHAPLEIVRGAEAAAAEKLGEIVLVGDENVVGPLLKPRSGIEIVHAPTAVPMKESPSVALRRHKDSSISKAFGLLKSGDVQAVVSAGNSGAVMAFAIFTLGRIPGVERPAIITMNPNVRGARSILLDAGGNVDCRPSHLVQFAVMGSVFATHALGVEAPRVGILSNGEEETKGNELTRESHALLKDANVNYVGYIEGTDLYNGAVDVAVADGFVGNVVLKVSEGMAEAIMGILKEKIRASFKAKMGYRLLSGVFDALSRMVDYAEYGGAPLVGVDGVSIICHGKSKARAIESAIVQAKNFVGKNVNERIKDALEEYASFAKGEEH